MFIANVLYTILLYKPLNLKMDDNKYHFIKKNKVHIGNFP